MLANPSNTICAPAVKRPVENGAFAGYAALLRADGYSPLPIIFGTKKPALWGWSELCEFPWSLERIADYSRRWPRAGLGVALGFPVVAVDVDTDAPELLEAIASVLPHSPVIKTGAKGYSAFYRSTPGEIVGSRRLRDKQRRSLVEVLGAGTQTVLPPSPHPDGFPYRWITNENLLSIAASEFPEIPSNTFAQLEAVLEPWLYVRKGGGEFDFEPREDASPPAGIELRRYQAYARAALKAKADALAVQAEGGRNNGLFGLVCALGRYVHHGVIEFSELENAARSACDRNGWLKEDGLPAFRAVLRNALDISANDPLQVLDDRPRPSAKGPA